jgi:hypothetical protein
MVGREEEGDAVAGKDNAGGKRMEVGTLEESQQESRESNLQSEPGDVATRIVEHLQNVEVLLAREAESWEEQLLSSVQKFVSSDGVLERAIADSDGVESQLPTTT